MKQFSKEDGVILAFITEHALSNDLFLQEIELAVSELLTVIPVIVDNGTAAHQPRQKFIERIPKLARNHYIYFDVNNTRSFFHKLDNLLKHFYYLATPSDN